MMRVLRSTKWKQTLFGEHSQVKGYQVRLKTGQKVAYYLRVYDRRARKASGNQGYAWYVYIGGAFVPVTNGYSPTMSGAKMKAVDAARRDAARKEIRPSTGQRLYITKPEGWFGYIVPRRGPTARP